MKNLLSWFLRARSSLTIGCIALSAITADGVQAQNFFLNPGFEMNGGNGTVIATPWTFGNGATVGINNAGFGSAHSGTAFGRLGTSFNNAVINGQISQVIVAPSAGTYGYSFFLGGGNGSFSVNTFINGVLLGTSNATPQNGYIQYTQNVSLAAGPNTFMLTPNFVNIGNPAAISIDDFSLVFLFAAAQNLTLAPNLAGLAQNQNQLGIALGLTNAFTGANLGTTAAPNGVAGAFVNALNNTPAARIPAVLDSLSGEGITGTQNTAFTSSRLFTSSIADQILLFGGAPNSVIVPTTPAAAPLAYSTVQALPTPIRVRDPLLSRPLYSWRAWGTGFGASQRINANPVLGNAQQSIGIGGGAVGVDYTWAPGMLSGIALGGSDGSFNVGARQTSGSTTGGHAAFYTLAEFGNVYAASISSVSVFGNRTTRTVAGFGGLNSEILRGNFTSTEFRTRAEFGYRFNVAPGVTLTPFYAVEAAKLRSDGFNETASAGAGLFALNVRGQSASSVPMFFGARLTGDMDVGNGMRVRPSVQVAYVPELAPVRNQVAGLINLPGATFLTDGARPARSSMQVKAGAEMAVLDNVALSANFDGEFSNRANTYAGKGAVKVRW